MNEGFIPAWAQRHRTRIAYLSCPKGIGAQGTNRHNRPRKAIDRGRSARETARMRAWTRMQRPFSQNLARNHQICTMARQPMRELRSTTHAAGVNCFIIMEYLLGYHNELTNSQMKTQRRAHHTPCPSHIFDDSGPDWRNIVHDTRFHCSMTPQKEPGARPAHHLFSYAPHTCNLAGAGLGDSFCDTPQRTEKMPGAFSSLARTEQKESQAPHHPTGCYSPVRPTYLQPKTSPLGSVLRPHPLGSNLRSAATICSPGIRPEHRPRRPDVTG